MLIDDIISGCDNLPLDKSLGYRDSITTFKELLRSAAKFNLDDNVTRAITNLVAMRPSNIQSCLEFARRPHPVMWFEFSVRPRIDLLRQIGVDTSTDDLHPSRIGILIDDNPEFPGELYCGRAIIGWRHASLAIGEIAYTELLWDFRDAWVDWRNNEEKIRHKEKIASPRSTAYLYKKNPAELECYTDLMARFSIKPAWPHLPWIIDFVAKETDDVRRKFIAASQSDATSEATMILATLLLFNTTRALSFEEITYTKLNKARKVAGKPPLLSHKTASFYLSKARRNSYNAKGLTVQQGVVLQRVSGSLRSRYSIKRGTRQLFWIDPYVRGDAVYGLGPSITKMRDVKLSKD